MSDKVPKAASFDVARDAWLRLRTCMRKHTGQEMRGIDIDSVIIEVNFALLVCRSHMRGAKQTRQTTAWRL